MHNRLIFGFFLCIIILFGVCLSQSQTNPTSPRPALDHAVRIDCVIIAEQPAESEIRSLPQKGISHVVNVRTPEEMNDTNQVNFDEAKLLKELNIAYDILPIGSEKYPYRTEVLEAFAGIMQTARDTILLHCKIGARAQWLYAAYK